MQGIDLFAGAGGMSIGAINCGIDIRYAVEMDAKAKELNLLPPVTGYTDDGEAVYSLEDIAKHFGISFEEAEQHLLQMMDNRQKVGLSSDGVLTGSSVNINRVQ